MLMSAANMVFFKTTNGVLTDKSIRQALVLASDPQEIAGLAGYKTNLVTGPLLAGQLGYDPAHNQVTNNPAKAIETLEAAGWSVGDDGIRVKDGKKLTFKLLAQDIPEYTKASQTLQKQWRAVGVKMDINLENPADLQNSLTYHNYDALLYGITIGHDPDVFAYWHSTQADVRATNRLNFSEYSSKVADEALESGRNRTDDALRVVKYKPFLQAWQQDAPALGLYQPRFLYITDQSVESLKAHTLTSETDRLNNVELWMIRQARVTNGS